MSSRSVWSHGPGDALLELLRSALAIQLLRPGSSQALYVCSPWLSDFTLFQNEFGQFDDLFPSLPRGSEVRFGTFLAILAERRPVRLVTVSNETSEGFLRLEAIAQAENVRARFATDDFHEKGILAPDFYIEGSMNVTYSGVYVRGEKITYHAPDDDAGCEKLMEARLEFDRQWERLEASCP